MKFSDSMMYSASTDCVHEDCTVQWASTHFATDRNVRPTVQVQMFFVHVPLRFVLCDS